ncbi:MAG: DUF86 domain-containing protein [Caulobacter sp.]|nr:DUF86 domain-containing protein [Caulobacter sp.]
MRLDDILQAIGRIRTYTTGMTFETFADSSLRFDAVAMNVLVIGESIAHLPDRLKTDLGHLPWKSIVAVRNLVAHGYPELDERIMWDIAQNRLDELEAIVRPMLKAIQRP